VRGERRRVVFLQVVLVVMKEEAEGAGHIMTKDLDLDTRSRPG
jgi:hypothetical protein